MNREVINLYNKFNSIRLEKFRELSAITREVIDSKNGDVLYIEKLLDTIMEISNNNSEQSLYYELLNYLTSIDPESSSAYLQFKIQNIKNKELVLK